MLIVWKYKLNSEFYLTTIILFYSPLIRKQQIMRCHSHNVKSQNRMFSIIQEFITYTLCLYGIGFNYRYTLSVNYISILS